MDDDETNVFLIKNESGWTIQGLVWLFCDSLAGKASCFLGFSFTSNFILIDKNCFG
jgi:hypothetical protein